MGPVIGAGAIGVMTAAFPWFLNPVLADVLVFVVAIIICVFEKYFSVKQRIGIYLALCCQV